MKTAYLGIDVGATKTAVCVGTRHGEILGSARMPTDATKPVDSYFQRLLPLCGDVIGQAGLAADQVKAVGVGAPGPLDTRHGIILESPNMPAWQDVRIVERLENGLKRPVFFNNDANAAVLAEYYFGSNRGVKNIVYLTHSTGMGGGIIADGRLVQGATDTGGEVGHHILELDGPPCGCGLKGCFEAFCGGLNVANRLRDRIKAEKISTAVVAKAGGDPDKIDFKAFLEAAKDGDAFALREWQTYVTRLAQGVGNLIMILNPEVIILGTIAVHAGDFLMDPLREELKRFVWEWPLKACKLAVSTLGARIGELGALAVALGGEHRQWA
ncbi:MAG: ROK family protein [Kiritimatiellae bacterium]|nr:ROK family protein [Kiritimatiellia bacterium]